MLLWDLALSFWFCFAWRLKNLVRRPCQEAKSMLSLDLVLSIWYLLTLRLENLVLTLPRGKVHVELGLGSEYLVPSYLEAGELGLALPRGKVKLSLDLVPSFWLCILPWGWRTWAWPCQEAKMCLPMLRLNLVLVLSYLEDGELGSVLPWGWRTWTWPSRGVAGSWSYWDWTWLSISESVWAFQSGFLHNKSNFSLKFLFG